MRRAGLMVCVALLAVSAVGVVRSLAMVNGLLADPLLDSGGGYDIARANAATFAYLEAVLAAVIGLLWLVLAVALMLWPRRASVS